VTPKVAPTEISEILSPLWLTPVLAAVWPGAVVEKVSIVEDIVTTAQKVRFDVTYRMPAPANALRAFCVKGFFGPDAQRYRSSGAAEAEVHFYQDLAAHLSLRVPRCIYGGIDAANGHGIIIMEDLVVRGARFLTALEPYSKHQAEGSLDQLARLHASHWNGSGLDSLPWLKPQLQQLAAVPVVATERVQSLMDGPRGAPFPAAMKDAARIYRGLGALSERLSRESQCLVHGDCHAGNVFEESGSPGLIDWQLLQRSCWSLDVAYHIGAVLTVQDREKSERELLAHYLQRLRAHGVSPPSSDDAWLLYRVSVLYGYYLWAITQRVVPEITIEFVRRLGTSVMTHDSFGLLGV
jgi:thiamine kinase-like enzyme